MECSRKMIYFNRYENGCKAGSAGYAGVFVRGGECHVQLYYRGGLPEDGREIRPVYEFMDGSRLTGEGILINEGMAMAGYDTRTSDFFKTGKKLNQLTCIYIEGAGAFCGGRVDGGELAGEEELEREQKLPALKEESVAAAEEEVAAAKVAEPSLTGWMDTVAEVMEQEQAEEEASWTIEECFERFPELKLPYDGARNACCRLTLEDMEHLPEEWQRLKSNHFLLHGYYEYKHIILTKLNCRCGEHYAVGVPGKLTGRDRYMAECFGFRDFAPLEQGNRCNGSFGYWYYYLPRSVAFGR